MQVQDSQTGSGLIRLIAIMNSMNKVSFSFLLFLLFIANSAFAQYQLIEMDGDRSALYFNSKLDNIQGVIYTSMFENFASPRKINASDIPIKDKGDLYSSEAIVMRLRCKDKSISMVDGQKFLNQNMQGGMVSYEEPLSEKEVKWVKLENKYFDQEPYQSMLAKCNFK
jgi:hypothetical protein